MKASLARALAVSGVLVLLLPGCTKRYVLKIKELEDRLAETELAMEEKQTEAEDEMYDKEASFEDQKQELENTVQNITQEKLNLEAEITRLNDEIESLKRTIDERTPKDENDQGHDNYNPAKDDKYSNAMVSLAGDGVSGCGFIAKEGGKHYLYTTAEGLRDAKNVTATTAGGVRLEKLGNLECAEGCPFVRIEVTGDTEDLTALEIAAGGRKLDSGVRLAAMWAGIGGSVNGELTTSYGFSDERIQLDESILTREFIGGPVLETATGKTLGIVTRQTRERSDLWGDANDAGEEYDVLQAIRVNRSINWTAVPVTTFLAESQTIAEYDRFTKVLLAFAAMNPSPDGLEISASAGGDVTIKSVLEDAKGLQAAREALQLHDNLANKKGQRLGEADLKKRINSLFSSLGHQSKTLGAKFDPNAFSPFQKKAAAQSQQWRKRAEQDLADKMEAISSMSLKPDAPIRDDRDDRDRRNRRNRD